MAKKQIARAKTMGQAQGRVRMPFEPVNLRHFCSSQVREALSLSTSLSSVLGTAPSLGSFTGLFYWALLLGSFTGLFYWGFFSVGLFLTGACSLGTLLWLTLVPHEVIEILESVGVMVLVIQCKHYLNPRE